jgi:hypothetical protein
MGRASQLLQTIRIFVSAHKLRWLLLAFGAPADLVMGENPNRNTVHQPADEIESGRCDANTLKGGRK